MIHFHTLLATSKCQLPRLCVLIAPILLVASSQHCASYRHSWGSFTVQAQLAVEIAEFWLQPALLLRTNIAMDAYWVGSLRSERDSKALIIMSASTLESDIEVAQQSSFGVRGQGSVTWLSLRYAEKLCDRFDKLHGLPPRWSHTLHFLKLVLPAPRRAYQINCSLLGSNTLILQMLHYVGTGSSLPGSACCAQWQQHQ